jgi:hypothetical protein
MNVCQLGRPEGILLGRPGHSWESNVIVTVRKYDVNSVYINLMVNFSGGLSRKQVS